MVALLGGDHRRRLSHSGLRDAGRVEVAGDSPEGQPWDYLRPSCPSWGDRFLSFDHSGHNEIAGRDWKHCKVALLITKWPYSIASDWVLVRWLASARSLVTAA